MTPRSLVASIRQISTPLPGVRAAGSAAFWTVSGGVKPSWPTLSAVIVDRLDIGAEEFEEATGWAIKPEGACKGEVCVPLPGTGFDLLATTERLGMAVVSEAGLWAVGPETVAGRALMTADTSDFHLPDLDGEDFQMSSLRGQKVLVVSWAPY